MRKAISRFATAALLASAILLGGCTASSFTGTGIPLPISKSHGIDQLESTDHVFKANEAVDRYRRKDPDGIYSKDGYLLGYKHGSLYDHMSPSARYEDSRWPTTNRDLLAIPEDQRWYNASAHVYTYCTIAGPVKEVHHAYDSYGSPTFIDIGAKYPDSSRVTLVIWDDAYYQCQELITSLERNSNCWISVSGYLDVYNGAMQFTTSEPVEYTWWWNVH